MHTPLRLIAAATTLFIAGTLSQHAFAQASATESADATANVIAPIGLSHIGDLGFADFIVTGAGTVVVDASASRSATGSVTLAGGTPTVPTYTVTGESGRTYQVDLPADSAHSVTNGVDTIDLISFVDSFGGTDAAPLGGTIGTSDVFTVGATLNILGAVSSGPYSGSFDVIVAYN